MFMGSQNFPVSWGRNFVGSVIRIIFINIKQMIYRGIYIREDINSWARKATDIGPPLTMMIPLYLMFTLFVKWQLQGVLILL